MFSIIVKRLLFGIPVLIATTVVMFFLQSLIPGDAARAIVGATGTPADYLRVRKQLHLDLSTWDQYLGYIGRLLHGDMGASLFTQEQVSQTLSQRLPVTLTLIVGATVSATCLGVLIGAISARSTGAVSRLVDVFALAGMALPNFWVALVMISLFAVKWQVFPASGFVPFDADRGLWFKSLVLPVAALAMATVAQIAKITRHGITEAMGTPYMRTLRASGLGELRLLWKHALRNSGVNIMTVVGMGFISSLAGSFFVENVFALPGLGSLVNAATTRHDVPVIIGVAVTYASIVIVVNLLIDMSYVIINPRVRTR